MDGDSGRLKGLMKTFVRGFKAMNDSMVPSDDNRSEMGIKRKRFRIILVTGLFFIAVMFLISISISSGGVIPIDEAFRALISAISKGGSNLTTEELYVFSSRLPRIIAGIGVGAGLAIAGCMFQALIRNPLVDPYITGVSSGAGCIAVAMSTMISAIPVMSGYSSYIIPLEQSSEVLRHSR